MTRSVLSCVATRRVWRGARTLLLLSLLVSACSMNLRSEPGRSDAGIAGHWQLHAPQREALADTLRVVMKQAREQQDKRDHLETRHRPQPDIDLSAPDADDAAPNPAVGHGHKRIEWEVREQIEQQEALLNAVLPSDQLQIIQTATRIELLPSGGGHRRFDMGVRSTLLTNYATFHIESGWQANEFVVHTWDTGQKIDVVERYQRMDDHLRMQVRLKIPDAREQMFTADYVLIQP